MEFIHIDSKTDASYIFYLVCGVIIFFSIHLLPSFPSLRNKILGKIGKTSYTGLFSVIALIGLIFIISGKVKSPHIPIWDPPFWGILMPVIVMPVVFMLLISSYLPSNIKSKTRHPMLLGVILWSISHLTINGDLASIILFGSFATYSVIAIRSTNRRMAAQPKQKHPIFRDLTAAGGGVALYAIVLFFHNTLFGVSTFG